MADNLVVTAGTGTNVASDEVTYSGDTAKLGIVRLVHVDGAEGSKTVKELVRLEDAAHTSADPGVPVLGVRQDTAASLAQTDGDYTMPIFDASGRLHVNAGANALPTGAATSAKQDTGNTSVASIDTKLPALGQALAAASVPVVLTAAQITTLTPPTPQTDALTDTQLRATAVPVSGTVAVTNAGLTEVAAAINASSQMDVNIAASAISFGGTSSADDADFTAGTTPGTPVMGVYDSTPDTVTDGDLGTIGINSTRAVRTVVEAGTANIGDVDVASIAAGDNNIGNVDIVTLPGDVEADIDQIRDQIDLITPDIEEIRVDADAIRVATELLDDTVYTDDTSTHATGTSKGIGIMAAATPTDTAVNANDIGMVGMTVNREMYVSLTTALPAGSAAIGKLAANSGVDIGDVDVTSCALPTGAATSAKQPALGTAGSASTDVITIQGIASGTVVPISVATIPSHAVTNAGTFAVQATGTVDLGATDNAVLDAIAASVDAIDTDTSTIITNTGAATTALQIMDDWDNAASDGASVSGDVAHDAADAGEPVKVGGVATVTEQTAVSASGDRVNASFTSTGKQIQMPYTTPEYIVSGAITSAMTGTTSTSLVAAPAAGLRNYLTTIIVSNAHATVGTDVVIQDGSGGTTLLTIPAAAVYGGAVINLPVPLRQPTTATAIYCANVTTGASTKVSAVGYKGI